MSYHSRDIAERVIRGVNGHIAAQLALLAGTTPFQTLADEFNAASAMYAAGSKTYEKPAFGLSATHIDGQKIGVREEVITRKPFCNLLHFQRDTSRNDPKLLIVAPMSGHYATLLRGTVASFLPHHDVFITDWKNARDVAPDQGDFDLDTYTQYIIDFLHDLGPNTHVMAVCQPTVPVLVAVSALAARKSSVTPPTLTLLAGPVDTAAAPTEVSKLAENRPFSWFKTHAIETVPASYAGAGRKVYPGHFQLTGFLAMNPDRHLQSAWNRYNHLRAGDGEAADKIGKFYDEYLSVMDLTADFYLQTIDRVFQRRLLAKGEYIFENQRVRPETITQTALLTIEGGKDDIAAVGQTAAAHRLCSGLPPTLKFSHIQPDVGHYGTFEGKRFRSEILPRIVYHIREHTPDKTLKYDEIPADTSMMPPNFHASAERIIPPPLALQKI